MTLTREALMKISQSVPVIASAAGTQVGQDIPEDKVRYVWGVVFSNPTAGALTIQVYEGDAALPMRNEQFHHTLPSDDFWDQHGDPLRPLFIIRPQKAIGSGAVTCNQLYAVDAGAAVECTFLYYEL